MRADSAIVLQPEAVVPFEYVPDFFWDSNSLFTVTQRASSWPEVVNDDTSMARNEIPLQDYALGFCRMHPGDQYQRALSWQRVRTFHPERRDDEPIAFVRAYLCLMGEENLGDQIAYFASDADLYEGDAPLAANSAVDFLEFFKSVESEGQINLSCSPEGWLSASWRFPDKRGVSLWFTGNSRVMFAATDRQGRFIEADDGGEWESLHGVAAKLVNAGLLEWSIGRGSLKATTVWPVIAVDETLEMMGFHHRTYSLSGTENPTYLPTGASTFTPPIEGYRLMGSSTHSGRREPLSAATVSLF